MVKMILAGNSNSSILNKPIGKIMLTISHTVFNTIKFHVKGANGPLHCEMYVKRTLHINLSNGVQRVVLELLNNFASLVR